MSTPFISVCVPQYNRTRLLIAALGSLAKQTYEDFEVCISDDCSTDAREAEVLEFLARSGLTFVYRKQETNSRYDANLRASIGLAAGRFCFLLGNDDCLARPTSLEELCREIHRAGDIAAAISNYEEFATGRPYRRMIQTGVIGSGPETAVRQFRNFSFVSGIVLERAAAQRHATAKWDGSEMYQMYLGCRIIAEGGLLLGFANITVRKGIQLSGEQVDSYSAAPRVSPCPIVERPLPMRLIGPLVGDAIGPYLSQRERRFAVCRVFLQLLMFTYPFWIVEYRRVQSWKYAFGVCLGMRPKSSFWKADLTPAQKIALSAVYAVISISGMTMPIAVFNRLLPTLYNLAKSFAAGRNTVACDGGRSE